MKAYFKAFQLAWVTRWQYRANVVVSAVAINFGLLGTLPFFFLMYRGRESIAGFSLDEIVTYSLVAKVVSAVMMMSVAGRLGDMIRDGALNSYLLAPRNILGRLYAETLGARGIEVVATALILLAVAPLVLGSIVGPATQGSMVAFVLALLVASCISFLIATLIGALAFWLQEVYAVMWCVGVVIGLASGQVIPLAFFPDAAAAFARLSPLAALGDFPALIFLGRLDLADMLGRFSLYVLWSFVLLGVNFLVWRRGLRLYCGAGA